MPICLFCKEKECRSKYCPPCAWKVNDLRKRARKHQDAADQLAAITRKAVKPPEPMKKKGPALVGCSPVAARRIVDLLLTDMGIGREIHASWGIDAAQRGAAW